MGELTQRGDASIVSEGFYQEVSSILSAARNKAYAAVNFAMVEAYWEIGRSIVEQQGGEDRAEYGEALISGLSERLTLDFGKGFDPSNLRYMRLFYQAFPICDALRHELSWTHYRRLSRISDPDARMWYMNECADAKWSTRQLERQTNTMFRERLLASKDKEPVSAASARLQVVDNCLGDFVVLSRLERDAAGVHGEYVAKLKRVVLVLGDDMHV